MVDTWIRIASQISGRGPTKLVRRPHLFGTRYRIHFDSDVGPVIIAGRDGPRWLRRSHHNISVDCQLGYLRGDLQESGLIQCSDRWLRQRLQQDVSQATGAELIAEAYRAEFLDGRFTLSLARFRQSESVLLKACRYVMTVGQACTQPMIALRHAVESVGGNATAQPMTVTSGHGQVWIAVDYDDVACSTATRAWTKATRETIWWSADSDSPGIDSSLISQLEDLGALRFLSGAGQVGVVTSGIQPKRTKALCDFVLSFAQTGKSSPYR